MTGGTDSIGDGPDVTAKEGIIDGTEGGENRGSDSICTIDLMGNGGAKKADWVGGTG